MAGPKGIRQISEIANGVLDPVLARRAGINTTLLGMWDDVVGEDFADCTRPERIKWPRRTGPDDSFVPGTLTIACEGARALFLAHSLDQLIQRVNGIFGFPAIDRIKIVQKPVAEIDTRSRRNLTLSADQRQRLDAMLAGVEDAKLRAALVRLGTGVIGKTKGRG